MATQVQWRGGSTAEHSTFTGAAREVTVDTQKKTLVVHDGSTAGGEPLLREDQANLPTSVTNGISVPSANNVAISTGGAGRLFVDANGDVGIGITNPVASLHVSESAPTLRLQDSDGTNQYTDFQNLGGASYLTTRNNTGAGNFILRGYPSAEFFRITSDGKLGLGTSSPSEQLDIRNTSGVALRLQGAETDRSKWRINVTDNGSNGLFQIDDFSGASYSTNVTITDAGRVGIGTTSPNRKLQVEDGTTTGTFNLARYLSYNGTNAKFLDIRIDNTEAAPVVVLDAGKGAGSSPSLAFQIGSAERARIDSSGRLLVGTSTSIDSPLWVNSSVTSIAPGFQLSSTSYATASASLTSWQGGANNSANLVFNKSRSGTVGTFGGTALIDSTDLGTIVFAGDDGTKFVQGAIISAEVDGTPGANDMPGRLVFSTTADGASTPTERMRITSDGAVIIAANSGSVPSNEGFYVDNRVSGFNRNSDGVTTRFYRSSSQVGDIFVTTTSTAYNTSSDYRLKENVVPLTGAADRLNQLQVHRFNFIADPDTTVDGFIAHEAQAVVPECVTGTKDEVDDEGNPVYQGIDQSKLVPLLTAALQEALGRIETLEAEVAVLKAS